VTGFGGAPWHDAATLDGVLWFSNKANVISTDPTTATQVSFTTVTRAYTGDPAFAADGHHLMANSAAIDRGTRVGVATDIDGELRPRRWGCDLGADEFPVALRVSKRASPDVVMHPLAGCSITPSDQLIHSLERLLHQVLVCPSC
jgi:hypothetical protein